MKKGLRSAISIASLLAIAACGGGSSTGTGGTTPTPVPPPSPPPPPPPPPPVVISAVHSFSLIGEFRFYPNGYSSQGVYGGAPSDFGGFYPSQGGQSVGTVTSGSVPSNYATVDKTIFGFDLASGLLGGSSAPADATVISPLTSLLTGTNTESKLEQQLGISGSLFGLSTDRAIKTFSPSVALASSNATDSADGERLVAHQLRVLAVSAALGNMGGFGSDPSGFRNSDRDGLRKYLETASGQFIFTNSIMSSILRSADLGGQFPKPVYSDEVISAAAHLVNAYCSALGVRISTREQAARWQLGIWGYLIPELTRLLKANDSATAAEIAAVTNQQIIDATARLNEQLPVAATNGFFPQPDFYPIAKGGTYLVPAVDEGSNGDGPLNSNDLALRSSASNGIGGGAFATTITAVTVPALNSTEVSAVLNANGTVAISALAGFAGLTYFDYTVQLTYTGETRQGRVYVIVR